MNSFRQNPVLCIATEWRWAFLFFGTIFAGIALNNSHLGEWSSALARAVCALGCALIVACAWLHMVVAQRMDDRFVRFRENVRAERAYVLRTGALSSEIVVSGTTILDLRDRPWLAHVVEVYDHANERHRTVREGALDAIKLHIAHHDDQLQRLHVERDALMSLS